MRWGKGDHDCPMAVIGAYQVWPHDGPFKGALTQGRVPLTRTARLNLKDIGKDMHARCHPEMLIDIQEAQRHPCLPGLGEVLVMHILF